MKIILWFVVLIWVIFELTKSIKSYRKDKEQMNLISLIALSIMIPSGIILLASKIIDK